MPRSTDAREKALLTAEHLIRRQGYAATGLAQVLEESGAPKGSFYFHFPGGKEQLALEALERYGAGVAATIESMARRTRSADEFVRSLCDAIAGEMRHSGWQLGCAAQALANELAPGHPEFTRALRRIFASWHTAIARGLREDAEQPQSRAEALMAALEGARTLARVTRSAAPFEAVAAVFCDAGTT